MKRILILLLALASLLLAKVDINKADAKELATLKGIGATKAAAIVEYREANGKFGSIDELTKVKGIGKATVEKLKDEIEVGK